MKQTKVFLLIALITISLNSYSQNADRKNNISIAAGSQGYKGDLGSVWFKMDEELYGFAGIYYNRYLNKSFDLSISLTTGDYGHCVEEDDSLYREDGTEVLNMLGRLTCFIISGKYKFTNGYILKENARIAPYIFFGGGVINMSEHWWPNKERANTGYFGSINGGVGARYNFSEKFNFTYSLGFGYLTTDKLDKRSEGSNDMIMQSTGMLGFNF